jgi:hypothetical protein
MNKHSCGDGLDGGSSVNAMSSNVSSTRESAPPPVPAPVRSPTTPSATEPVPDSLVPAYLRNPLEFDPNLLASLNAQLRSCPFEAFEDAWACFPDLPPVTHSALQTLLFSDSTPRLPGQANVLRLIHNS